MSISKKLAAALAAIALAGGGFIATAAPANAATGSIDTGTIVKPKYSKYSTTVNVKVTLSALQGWESVSVRTSDYKVYGSKLQATTGSNTIPVTVYYDSVKAGKVSLGLYVSGTKVATRTITVIGQPQVTYYSVRGIIKKKSKKTISGWVDDEKDAKGKRAYVYFDKKGGKKKFTKVASAKIDKTGWFKAKTKKKLGKGSFQIRIKASKYTKAEKSFIVKWTK